MDLSSYFEQAATMANKVKNAIMNYSEYEAKVYDATNNDPWGTSSTLMMDIANAVTIMTSSIQSTSAYKSQLGQHGDRLTRYIALQLLEYLIKHGSEKVIDSARGHIYELRVLLHYNYIDEKRKDHGMNVKNRAKEIIELLESDEKIRTERIKAKENRSKYIGVDSSSVGFAGRGGTGSGNFGGSGSKYGGFGPGSAGSRSGRDSSSTFSDANITSSNFSSSRDSELPAPVSQQHEHKQRRLSQTKSTVAVDPPKPKPQQTVNLLDFGGGDDWSDFSSGNAAHAISPAPTGPTTSAFGNFADFSGASSATGVHANHMAPPAGFPPFGMPPMQPGGPAALMKQPQQATQLLESSGVSDFGDFTAFTSASR
ncbi:hypothetical protein BASA60_007380 [Batrachochytrium salamandrivorans]|nr:hypothetical protein BASA60_007380 [Batrachochytrium salamandrivorans]